MPPHCRPQKCFGCTTDLTVEAYYYHHRPSHHHNLTLNIAQLHVYTYYMYMYIVHLWKISIQKIYQLQNTHNFILKLHVIITKSVVVQQIKN